MQKMNQLLNFSYNGRNVRTVMIEGEPWWMLKDVCDVLELVNTGNVAARLDDDEKATIQETDNGGRPYNLVIISEPGLYSVILRSNKPEAREFKRWITHEVLPQIRRSGGYGQPKMPSVINADYLQEVVDHMRKLEEQIDRQGTLIAVQGQQIAELKPKADYYDLVLRSPDLVKISIIAKDYGMSGRAMNLLLHDMGIQYKQGDIWLLYQKYASYGYTSTKTHTYAKSDGSAGASVSTYWTQKGRLWIYEKLKSGGIIPLIERQAS